MQFRSTVIARWWVRWVAPLVIGAAVLCRGVAIAHPYAALVYADRPLSYWPLDDPGRLAEDVRGVNEGLVRGNIEQGVPGPAAGMRAMRFGPLTDPDCAGIDVSGDARVLAFATAGSLEAWFRTEEPTSILMRWRWWGYGVLIKSGTLELAIVRRLPPGHPAEGTLEEPPVRSTQSVSDGLWHHMVGAWDGTTLILYLDGVEHDRISAVGTAYYWGFAPERSEFAIGRDGDACGGFFQRFVGDLAHVAVYDYALTAAQVVAHHVAGRAPAPGPS